MSTLPISLAGVDYDRTRALFDGTVTIEGCETIALAMSPEQAFHRALRFHEFDITELSLSSYLVTVSRDISHYLAIPVFPSRMFRHSAIYIRRDRGIERPEDLKGKLIGVPEYQMTAAVWVRGMLRDDFDIDPADVRWRSGGLHEPGRREKIALQLPPNIDLAPIPATDTLSQQFDHGGLDGLISAIPPACFASNPDVGRLFPDYKSVEQDYYRRTGIFPIMHLVGIRRSLLERHPWLAVNAYQAYLRAKQACYRHLGSMGHLFTTLPWPVHELEEARHLMGEDFWSYGIEQNARVLETICRYAFEQGLTARPLGVEELFAPSTLDLARV